MFDGSWVCLGLACSFGACCGFTLVLFGYCFVGYYSACLGVGVLAGCVGCFEFVLGLGRLGLGLVCGLVYCCCDLPCSLGCDLLISWVGLDWCGSGYGCLSVVFCLGLVVAFGFLLLH